MYEKALIPIEDQQSYGEVHAAIASHFAPGNVQNLLKSIERAGLRIRDFEAVSRRRPPRRTPSPPPTKSSATPTRARSASSTSPAVEKVGPRLRAKYLKLYAYY